jgi:hypothetical protein
LNSAAISGVNAPHMMKTLTFALLVAGAGVASADGTPQNHHCKLADGSFDGT